MDPVEAYELLHTPPTTMLRQVSNEADMPSADRGVPAPSLAAQGSPDIESPAARDVNVVDVDEPDDELTATADPNPDSAAAFEDITHVTSDLPLQEDQPSDADESGGSEFLPEAGDESLSEGDDLPPQQKSRKINRPELQTVDLHDQWNKWEKIYLDLKLKVEAGVVLIDEEEQDYAYARRKLEGFLKQMSPADKQLPRCRNILAPASAVRDDRKRKIDEDASKLRKKGRVDVSTRSQVPKTRQSAYGAARKKKAKNIRPGHGRAANAEENEARQALIAEAVELTLQEFHNRAKEAFPEVDDKQLSAEVKDLELAANALRRDDRLAPSRINAWLIQGMKSRLFDYQFSGVGWMLEREHSRRCSSFYNPKGGILADQMGCGKTITMLAVVMSNPAPKTDRIKASLLLVPSSGMVGQWTKEIKKHCEPESLATSRFSRTGRLNTASLRGELILLMTYSEVALAWGKMEKAEEKRAAGTWTARDDEDLTQETLIFDTTFYRLIMDECHMIKNHLSAAAKAVFQLKSKIQWLISATPAPNRGEEYFSYFKVFNLHETENIARFKKFWFKKGPKAGLSHLEAGLENFQLCRTHTTKFACHEIFEDVPNSMNIERVVELSAWERSLYNIVVERHRDEVEKLKEQLADNDTEAIEAFERRGKCKSETGYMIRRILQLYMLTAHPFLLETLMHSKDFTMEKHLEVRAAMKESRPLLDQHLSFSEEAQADELDVDGSSSNPTDAQSQSQFSSAASDVLPDSEQSNIDTKLAYALGQRAIDRRCRGCHDVVIPVDAIITECGHAFCEEHFQERVALATFKGPEAPVRCSCREPVGVTKKVDQTELAQAYADFEAAEIPTGRGSKARKRKVERKRGDDFNGYQPKGQQRSVWLELSDAEHPTPPLEHSAKTREILSIIENWQMDAPDDKIIVFTQWILMARIIGRHLEDQGINFLYYFGDLSHGQREKNLSTFAENKDVKVMVMGLKCGGQGLDMHFANRVILSDPWWNNDGERQAFARVLRKVQRKKCLFVRLVADESIDKRIREIQDAKRELTEQLKKEWDPVRRQEIRLQYAGLLLGDAKATEKSKGPAKKRTIKLNIPKSSSGSSTKSVAGKPATRQRKTTKPGPNKRAMEIEDAMDMDEEAFVDKSRNGLFVKDD